MVALSWLVCALCGLSVVDAIRETSNRRSEVGGNATTTVPCQGPPNWETVFLGNKRPYTPPVEHTVHGNWWAPQMCVKPMLLKSFLLSRHSSRYPLREKTANMLVQETLPAIWEILLSSTDQVQVELKSMMKHLQHRCQWGHKFGKCSDCGQREAEDMGGRFWGYDDRDLQVNWFSTSLDRAKTTALSWRRGLDSEVKHGNLHGITFSPPEAPSQLLESTLRFYDTCKNHQDRLEEQTHKGRQHAPDLSSIGHKIFTVLFPQLAATFSKQYASHADKLGKLSAQLAENVYTLCQEETAVGPGPGSDGPSTESEYWCALLDTEDVTLISMAERREFCLEAGPCAFGEYSQAHALPMLDLFKHFLDEEVPKSGIIPVQAYFAHENTLWPLLTLLGFVTDDSQMPSMLANLRIDVLSCGADQWASAWLNEEPLSWPDAVRSLEAEKYDSNFALLAMVTSLVERRRAQASVWIEELVKKLVETEPEPTPEELQSRFCGMPKLPKDKSITNTAVFCPCPSCFER